LNTRSLSNKMAELITFKFCLTYKFMIICVTKTWENDVTKIGIPDYTH